jgi:hypothetical protein
MEETLDIGGKIYMASSSAARKTGYAPDYIGQLCRSRKVDAIRVGRAWFVGVASFSAYAEIDLCGETKTAVPSENGSLISSAKKGVLPATPHPRSGLFSFVEIVVALFVCCATVFIGVQSFRGDVTRFSVERIATISARVESIVNDGTVMAHVATVSQTSPYGFGDSIALATYHSIATALSNTRIALMTVLYKMLVMLGFETRDGSIAEHVMVVVPAVVNSADATEMKEKIRNSFSDPVDVSIANDGTGIITPTFSNGEKDEYMFIMVPVQ